MKLLLRTLLIACLAAPAAAAEGGFDCAEGADGEIEPYVWTGEAWVPNPAYVPVNGPTS